MPIARNMQPCAALFPSRRSALGLAVAVLSRAFLAPPARGANADALHFGPGRATPTRGTALVGPMTVGPREVSIHDGEGARHDRALDLRKLRALEAPLRTALDVAQRDDDAEGALATFAARLLADPRDDAALAGWLVRLARGWVPAAPLGPPLAGPLWVVPDESRHHAAHAASAFALDLTAVDADGSVRRGKGEHNADWASWDAPLVAVADGRVLRARDDRPDDEPFQGVADPVRANDLVLEIPGGLAFYQHLRQGSLAVAASADVKRGDVLAHVGNSGNASWPHLHFAVYERFEVDGRGGTLSVPCAFDAFRVTGLRERLDGKTRSLDVRCTHVPLQEGWMATFDG